jgi:hypothetical protein
VHFGVGGEVGWGVDEHLRPLIGSSARSSSPNRCAMSSSSAMRIVSAPKTREPALSSTKVTSGNPVLRRYGGDQDGPRSVLSKGSSAGRAPC